ncbi:carbohydrate kinase family protein [Nonomuraea typhae]|uniref:Carbohydrate kinase family protein n=1 Tax=Nonomuraea typhae TaxID=2603600 RepID=A0ABW7Z3M8_9ACTN
MTTHDILVIGGAGVDTTVYVPALPLPYADTHTVPPVVDRIGNTGAGVALGCAALGLRTKFVDLIGDDPQGELVRRALSGIDCSYGTAMAGTRRSVLLVDPDGRRSSLFDPRATPGEELPASLYSNVRPRHAHLSITDFSRKVFATLQGVPTSTDLHDWDGVNPYHEDFAYQADLVFLSAAALPDPAATMRMILTRGRATTVVCTRGADGCLVLERDGNLRAFPAAPLPGPITDTNGAGDAFVSGFLYGKLRGLPAASSAHLGPPASSVQSGASASSVQLGSPASSAQLEASATSVQSGVSGSSFYLGPSATSVQLGPSVSSAQLGVSATSVRLGALAGAHACTVEGTHEAPITEPALLAAHSRTFGTQAESGNSSPE